MHRPVTIAALLAALSGCGEMVDNDRAQRALEAEGYKDIAITGKHGMAPQFAGCSDGDAVGFDASATNHNGKRVRLLVCCGLVLKSCTVRHP